MALFEMVMPKMGESIMEGTILRWLKKVGERIEQDESVLEVATDKVDTEVPAIQAGYIMDILVKEGEVVAVGATIALVSSTPLAVSQPATPPQTPVAEKKSVFEIIADNHVPEKTPEPQPVSEPPAESVQLEQQIETLTNQVYTGNTLANPVQEQPAVSGNPFLLPEPAAGRFYSPLVLTIAREEKVSMQELEYIAGTGGDNRVTKKDILNYVNFKKGILPESEIPVLQPLPPAEPAEIHHQDVGQQPMQETDYKALINLEKTYPVKEQPVIANIENPMVENRVFEEDPEADVPEPNTTINLEKTSISKPLVSETEEEEAGEIVEIIKPADKVLTIPLEKTTGKNISLDKPYSQSYEVTETEKTEHLQTQEQHTHVQENPAETTPAVDETQKEPEKYFKPQPEEPVDAPAVSVNGKVEIIEMDRMRKMIAQRMVDSKRISPHVTSFVEADVTNIVFWRNKVKEQFKESEGENITFTPVFIEALAKALRDFPMVNISVDGDRILVKKDINIGMAVALPNGNLIVPVIHNADQLNLVGLTKRVNDLAKRARENKLKLEDLEGGTYTMSNIGSFGNVMGTPIIMQPQVAIMSFGSVQKKPAVIETPYGDTLGIRQLMFLSHSYDHRVIDGALGGMFVRRVADYLENFDVNRKVF